MKMIAEMSATQRSEEGIISLGTRNGIELAILKRTEKSTGKIIAKPDSTDLIDGVRIEPLQIYPDDRGFFTEIARLGRGLATDMVPDNARKIQISLTLRPDLTVVADQVGSPTFTRDLARMIRDLVRMEARGTLNVTNEGSCSWFEFAQETLRQAGRGSVRVSPITSAEARRPARRPSYSVLSPASLKALGLRMRPWRDALSAYLRELQETGNLG
jgi:hypothetical protein